MMRSCGIHVRRMYRVVRPCYRMYCSSLSDLENEIHESGGTVRIGIVGAGPAGFYTAHSLLKDFTQLQQEFKSHSTRMHIDIFDRDPIGNGLIRSGVAPDHPEVKHVQNRFQELLEQNSDSNSNHLSFIGNVNVGRSIHPTIQLDNDIIEVPISVLQNSYHAIVFACGCEGENRLAIKGSELLGVHAAGAFVRFYNGGFAPAASDTTDFNRISLSPHKKVAIIGHGNVALDAARVILKGRKGLDTTDITERALQLLDTSTINEVHIFGRRGPAQASFTNQELREMFELENCKVFIAKEDLMELNEISEKEISSSRIHKRMLKLMSTRANLISKEEMMKRMSEDNPSSFEKSCYIHFCMNPYEYLDSNENPNCISEAIFERTTLEGELKQQKAIGTGKLHSLKDCGLVLESIGYYPIPIKGILFNNKNRVSHSGGRVLTKEGNFMERTYVSGWFKRGPSGIIATNVWDAQETARSIIEDLVKKRIPLNNRQPFYNGLIDTLKENNLESNIISWKEWLKIEEIEEKKGQSMIPPKPREKFLSPEAMKESLKTL